MFNHFAVSLATCCIYIKSRTIKDGLWSPGKGSQHRLPPGVARRVMRQEILLILEVLCYRLTVADKRCPSCKQLKATAQRRAKWPTGVKPHAQRKAESPSEYLKDKYPQKNPRRTTLRKPYREIPKNTKENHHQKTLGRITFKKTRKN